jgi:hypothetical protein
MWGCLQTELGQQWLRHHDNRCDGRQALMWKITTRGFTLQEVLIMAATNVASALTATDKSERTIGTAPRTETQQASGECHGKGD